MEEPSPEVWLYDKKVLLEFKKEFEHMDQEKKAKGQKEELKKAQPREK